MMKVKLTNMCMILDGENVLVQERTKKDWPGITFPGGKVEADESIYTSCVREVKEETGLNVMNLKPCGIIHYELKEQKERWIMYLYKTSSFTGKLDPSENEDKVYWMKLTDLPLANLSNDMDIYLKLFMNDEIVEAHAYWEEDHSLGFTYY